MEILRKTAINLVKSSCEQLVLELLTKKKKKINLRLLAGESLSMESF